MVTVSYLHFIDKVTVATVMSPIGYCPESALAFATTKQFTNLDHPIYTLPIVAKIVSVVKKIYMLWKNPWIHGMKWFQQNYIIFM